jgi:putative tricarboxylic transport membrane protein
MSDRIFAGVWLAVCGVIVFQIAKIAVPFAYEPLGPKAFPILMAFLMAVCSVLLFLKPETNIEWPQGALLAKSGLLVVILLAYATLFAALGFPLATALMVLATARLFGGSWTTSMISAVSIGFLGYMIFDRLLEVSLPAGPLGFLG